MHSNRWFLGCVGTCLVLASLLALPAQAGVGDGTVLSTTKIQDNGPDTARFNIVIMGDGFTAAEMATYETRAQEVVDAFNAQISYGACGGAVNFYRVNIASDESGSDKPAACYSPAESRATYLDTHYCSGGIQRCIWSTNTALVQSTAAAATSNWNFVVVLVNDAEHGGCAGSGLTFNSTGTGFQTTVMHELGHALGGLGDEYSYGGPDSYTGAEPSRPNLTIQTNRSDVKWFDLIEATTPVPTWERTDCTSSAETPPATLEGKVGTFEGGAYSRCDIYHPERSCLMRILSADFCAVCNRRIRQVMAVHFSEGNLSITPWGYYQDPKVHPYWQTPDVWVDNDGDSVQEPDEPLIGKPDNKLFARVTNTGTLDSGAFEVRFSYVPYTGVINLDDSQPIGTVPRPSLGAGLSDEVQIDWPLDAIPPEFAGIDHFCVIVEILHDECSTGDNRAQNNFVNVQTLSPAPAPVPFFITNILDVDAIGALEVEPIPPVHPGWKISANVPNLDQIPLAPHETKKVVLEIGRPARRSVKGLQVGGEGQQGDSEIVEQDFDVTFRLDGQVLGGVSPRVRALPQREGRRSLSLHLGAALPRGNLDVLYDEGPSIVLDADYRLRRGWYLVGLVGYYRFDASVPRLDDAELWSVSLDLKWEILPGAVRPYLQAGPGIYIPDSGSSEAGYNLGAGVDFRIAPAWFLEAGVDYHNVAGASPSVEFTVPHVGLIFRF